MITVSNGHCGEGVSDVVGRLGCKLKLVVHPPTVSRSLQTTALVDGDNLSLFSSFRSRALALLGWGALATGTMAETFGQDCMLIQGQASATCYLQSLVAMHAQGKRT